MRAPTGTAVQCVVSFFRNVVGARIARPHDIKSALPFFGKAPCIRFYSILARNALSLSVFGAPSTSLGSPCSQITP